MHQPRPYQDEGTRFIVDTAKGRAFLGDEMGLGKTGTTYNALKELKPNSLLIVCGKNAQYVWQKEAPLWGVKEAPKLVRGKPAERRKVWLEVGSRGGAYTCTREVFKRDLAAGWLPVSWDCLVVDEAHKDCNRKSQNFSSLAKIKSSYIILLTGNKLPPQKLWALFHLIRPKQFTSYWKFVNLFCNTQKNEMGYMEIIGPKNTQGLHNHIKDFYIARTKKQVRPDMPPKQRIFLPVEMEADQARIYDDLCEDMLSQITEERFLATPTVLSRIMRLRQLLITPKLLDPELTWGASIDQLVELLEEASDKHMAVFCPFREALSPIRHRLVQEGFLLDDIIMLHGGISVEELSTRIARFRERRGIALVTIKFAESFDLVPATWGVFIGSEWDPNENWQAEDRLHRGEIKDPITIYYLQNRNTVDESLMMPLLDQKARTAKLTTVGLEDFRKALQKRQSK